MASFAQNLGNLLGGTPSKKRSSSGVAAFQKPFLESLFSGAQGAFDQGQFGQVAGFNPLQQQAQEQQLGFAQGFGQQSQPAQNALQSLLSGQVNMDAFNPIADQLTNRLTRSFNEDVIPGIRRNSLFGSGRQTSRPGIETQQAAQGFQENLGDQLSALFGNALQGAQGAQGQALGLAPGILGLGAIPGDIMSQIGGQQQGMQQAQLNAPFYTAVRRSSKV